MTNWLPLRATLRVEDSDREDNEFRAKLVGFTPEGAPILQFLEDPGTIRPDRGTVLGRAEHGQLIVAFRKRMTAIVDGNVINGRSETTNDTSGDSMDDAEKGRAAGPGPSSNITRPPPVIRIATPPSFERSPV